MIIIHRNFFYNVESIPTDKLDQLINEHDPKKTAQESSCQSTTVTIDAGLATETHAPPYDLSALWDKHCEYEFDARDVAATMSTMVSEPYVNHIPTMTGGVGAKELSRFYEHHFVNGNPKDTHMIPISRVVGTDRVVDEMLFCFTHDREIDWMLPGIAPTGKPVKVPLVAIVAFRDGKLCNEHIYWDQASVLV